MARLVQCQGSDCVRSQTKLDARSVRACPTCSKLVCVWCWTHCTPSHECVTQEGFQEKVEQLRKDMPDGS